MTSPKRGVILFVVAVGVVATGSLGFWVYRWGEPNWVALVFFWLLYVLGDRFELDPEVRGIPQAGLRPLPPTLSAGFLVLLACSFATDPLTASLVGVLTPFGPGRWRGVVRSAFNASQFALSAGAAATVFTLLREGISGSATGLIVGALLGALSAVALNTSLVGGVLAIERRRSIREVLKELAWPAASTVAYGLIALLVGLLYESAGPFAALLLLSPLFVLRWARQGKLELDASHERTLRAFVRAVELKDEYTSRHSERVAEIAIQIHRAMGAPPDEALKRYYGALLHDIGKIAVSARILRKPGRLSDEEFEVVKRHPTTGAMVVASIDFAKELVPEVLHHHERIEGGGYPSGLVGDEIPSSARVLAVADTFEALTSNRPYRGPLSNEEAIAEMRRCAGTQLDPQPVEVLASLLKSGHAFPALPARRLEDLIGSDADDVEVEVSEA